MRDQPNCLRARTSLCTKLEEQLSESASARCQPSAPRLPPGHMLAQFLRKLLAPPFPQPRPPTSLAGFHLLRFGETSHAIRKEASPWASLSDGGTVVVGVANQDEQGLAGSHRLTASFLYDLPSSLRGDSVNLERARNDVRAAEVVEPWR
jgi:hypothetical protein